MEEPTAKSIFLYEKETSPGFTPWLEPFNLESSEERGAVIICPGGGYSHRASHEGPDIAEKINAAGIHAFVLEYSVSPAIHPQPIQDAAYAVRYVRSRAAEWNINPNKIALCGFSAGGHLSASLGVHFDEEFVNKSVPLTEYSCRPDALILSYPVISSGEERHAGSFENLLGEDETAELMKLMSLEHSVNEKTPETFLWHTFDDSAVPVSNSLVFANALNQYKIPFECHIYPHGAHGLGLAPKDKHVATWSRLCVEWLQAKGY